MRIISKFKDYYDGVQRFGMDKSNVYVRKHTVEEIATDADRVRYKRVLELLKKLPSSYSIFRRANHRSTWNILFVCGRMYPFMLEEWGEYGGIQERRFMYAKDEILNFHLDVLEGKDRERFTGDKHVWTYNGTVDSNQSGIEYAFSSLEKENVENLFHDVGTPIFVVEKGEYIDKYKIYIERNVRLSDYNFQKVKDPYEMYQELSMYIPGVLGGTDSPPAKMSDIVMRDKKGFNEWSFKTMPGKKKRGKKDENNKR